MQDSVILVQLHQLQYQTGQVAYSALTPDQGSTSIQSDGNTTFGRFLSLILPCRALQADLQIMTHDNFCSEIHRESTSKRRVRLGLGFRGSLTRLLTVLKTCVTQPRPERVFCTFWCYPVSWEGCLHPVLGLGLSSPVSAAACRDPSPPGQPLFC